MVSIKDIIEEHVKIVPEGEKIAVMLSGGIDSLSLLATAKRMGYEVKGYTFAMQGTESTDLKVARFACEYLGCEHETVWLPTDIDVLKADILMMVEAYCLTKKTEIECIWPFMYAYCQVEEKYILNGLESDKHFGLSKKARINHIGSIEEFDKFKRESFAGLRQHNIHRRMLDDSWPGFHTLIFPFVSRKMIDRLCGHTWEELNKPNEKQPVRDLFTEAEQQNIPMRKHQNLQIGDSGIRDHFEKLLKTDWNVRGAKSVTAIYNDVIKGRITHVIMDRQKKLF